MANIAWAISGLVGVIVFSLVTAVVFAGLAWAALYSAGVARRRIRLSTEQPLWVVITHHGEEAHTKP